MAKITALTEVTSLATGDLFAVVDDPAGTPVTKKVTVANVKESLGVNSVTTGLSDHLADTVDAHDASAVSFTPVGTIAATDVQTAIAEVATDAAAAYATSAQGATADTAVQPARTISTTAPLTGGGDLSANRTLAVSAASTSAAGVVELATNAEALTGTSTSLVTTAEDVAYVLARQPEFFTVAVGDETTALTTGTAKVSFRAPFAFTLVNLRASLVTASSSGIPTIDVNENGTTLMSTNKLTIDATELTSVTAATAVGITDAAVADDALITIDIDVAGTGAAGLKVTFFVVRAP